MTNNVPGWQEFFDGYARKYEEQIFTKNTEFEVKFLADELRLSSGMRVLDMGCGIGRHSVGLAALGCAVTGVDLSQGMLDVASEKAKDKSVEAEFVRSDARDFVREDYFDAAICLCEGSFGLLGVGDDPIDHDLTILSNIAKSMKSGAKLVLNCLSVYKMARQSSAEDIENGVFDTMTATTLTDVVMLGDDAPPQMTTRERGYLPTELALMARVAGLEVLNMWGGTAGSWNKQKLDPDEWEIMMVAKKP